MRDPLTDLLRERLTGHEMDVPPGAWGHVSDQLAAAASGESLRQALQDKFRDHQVHPDPSAWANIQGQLGHGAAAGSGFGAAWIAAGAAAVALTAGLLMWGNQGERPGAPAPATVETALPTVAPPAQAPANTATGNAKEIPLPQPPASSARKAKAAHATNSFSAGQTSMDGLATSTSSEARQPDNDPNETSQPAAQNTAALPVTPGNSPAAPGPEADGRNATAPSISSTGPGTSANKPSNRQADANDPASTGGPDTDAADTDPFQRDEVSAIFIPNVFSPQADGVNDVLKIVARDYAKADVRIFSAKGGVLVFRTNDLANMWDGRLANGNNAEEGYYRCIVLLTDADGHTRVKSEVVRLYR